MRFLRISLVLAFAGSCFHLSAAQPLRFNYQAKVSGSGGAALTGTHVCVFRLYEGGGSSVANAGTLRYEEVDMVPIANGILNHVVGAGGANGPPLGRSVFATDNDLFLQMSIDGVVTLPRTRLETVPFAINAGEATTASVALEALHAASSDKAGNGELRTTIDPAKPGFVTPYVISQPGSYYLAGNLAVASGNAINITTSSVTLDLNGFLISSSANPAAGIAIQLGGMGDSLRAIRIRNGHIAGEVNFTAPVVVTVAGSGFMDGISLGTGATGGALDVSEVSVRGCAGNGIYLGTIQTTAASNCEVRLVGSVGITAATVRSCLATDCGNSAIVGLVVDNCTGASRAGNGINSQTMASNSLGSSTSESGVVTNGTVNNCSGFSQSQRGIYSASGNVTNCKGQSSTGPGIYCGGVANGSSGVSIGNFGLYAGKMAISCTGESYSGMGLFAPVARSSQGFSNSQTGLWAPTLADQCVAVTSSTQAALSASTANLSNATNAGSGFAIGASVAIGCSSGGGDIFALEKYLGTP